MKKHLFIVSIVGALLSIALAYLFFRIDFIPGPSSLERDSIDTVLRVLFTIAAVFFAVIITVFVYSLLFFRQRAGESGDGPPIRGYSPLEISWTVIPLLLVLGLSAYGGIVLNRITQVAPPQQQLRVNVTAARFVWQFEYPDYQGIKSFELELPVDQEVVLRIESKDVVHSFWVPEFGPKQDAVPGIITELRITPNKIGQYQVMCSQLCGYGHTYMTAPVRVVSSSDFQKWVQQQAAQQPK